MESPERYLSSSPARHQHRYNGQRSAPSRIATTRVEAQYAASGAPSGTGRDEGEVFWVEGLSIRGCEIGTDAGIWEYKEEWWDGWGRGGAE